GVALLLVLTHGFLDRGTHPGLVGERGRQAVDPDRGVLGGDSGAQRLPGRLGQLAHPSTSWSAAQLAAIEPASPARYSVNPATCSVAERCASAREFRKALMASSVEPGVFGVGSFADLDSSESGGVSR